MSKIICDVCGTTYPETASQCPICGSAKPENAALLETREQTAPKYTYVKGGRFSEKNVRKRNKEKMAAAKTYAVREEEDEGGEERERSNVGLIITVIVLLLAIFAVLLYLYFTYFAPDFLDRFQKPDDSTVQTTTAAPEQTDPPQSTTELVISCTGINLSEGQIRLSNVGDGYLLNYSLEPADTTEEPVFVSSDPNVATVDANGKVTAVGPGSAVITVTCGSVQTQIGVTCDIVTEPPTEETTEPETQPQIDFELNRSDFTMKVGESWKIYDGPIGNTEITWRTGNHTVATVVNGTVKAVGKGTTTIYAEYNGVEYACIVRVTG